MAYKLFKPRAYRVQLDNLLNPKFPTNSALAVIKVGKKNYLHPEFMKRNTMVVNLATEESFQKMGKELTVRGLLDNSFPYLSWDCELN